MKNLKNNVELLRPLAVLASGISIIIFMWIFGAKVSANGLKDYMQELGYEARVVDTDCLVKYKGYWVRCEVLKAEMVNMP